MNYGREVAALEELHRDAPSDSAVARRYKAIIRAMKGEPDGDEEALKRFLQSEEHKRNVLRMRRR